MKKMTKVAAFVGMAVVSAGASASDWNVTQTATVTVAAPSLRQGPTTNVATSNQALNGIALDNANDDLATGSQLASITSSTGVALTQGPNVDGSNQAINFIAGNDVGSTGVITQTVNQLGTSSTALIQADAGGSGANVQGVNVTRATANVDRLSQVYSEAGNVALTQSATTTANNTQGVNYAEGAAVGVTSLNQSLTVTGTTTLAQGVGNTGGNNVQVGNGAVAITGDLDNTTQTVSMSAAVTLTQSANSANNTQALNMLRTNATTGDIGVTTDSTTQAVTASGSAAVTFLQDVQDSGNVQAGNLASSGGDVISLDQTVTASNATIVDFDQTPTAAGNTQAGNMIELRTAGDTIDDVNQIFTSSETATDFDQNSASGTLIQAGNFIDLNTGSNLTNATQSFTVASGTLTMDQIGGATGNLQALNATVDAAGAGSGGTIIQTLSVNATTFAMTQNNMTGSGQYGNFVGVKY